MLWTWLEIFLHNFQMEPQNSCIFLSERERKRLRVWGRGRVLKYEQYAAKYSDFWVKDRLRSGDWLKWPQTSGVEQDTSGEQEKESWVKNDTLKSADMGFGWVLRTAMMERHGREVSYNLKLYGYCNLINIDFLLQNVLYHPFIEKFCLEISDGRKVLFSF